MNFYVFNNSVPAENGMSGSDRRALEYTRRIVKKGYRVTVILPKVALARYEGSGAEFLLTDYKEMDSHPTFSFLMRRIKDASDVCKGLELTSSDVIYSSSDIIADSIPSLELKNRNKSARLVCGVHLLAPLPWKGFRYAFARGWQIPSLKDIYYYFSQKYILEKLKRHASLVLVSNSFDKKILMRKGFQEKQILVCYGAPQNDIIEKVPAQQKRFDAVYVGRFHEQKGIVDLMEIIRLVAREKKDFVLALVSDIPGEVLQRLQEKYHIKNNIRFFGFRERSEKYEIIKQSRLLLFPSFYESFGMAICEAMACGLGVVAYGLAIYKDIYPKGLVTAPIGDTADFANRILHLLKHKEELERVSADALDLSRDFNWDRAVEEMISLMNGGNIE
jgi:glycosyltransferase involved in cell wall biosynthesis